MYHFSLMITNQHVANSSPSYVTCYLGRGVAHAGFGALFQLSFFPSPSILLPAPVGIGHYARRPFDLLCLRLSPLLTLLLIESSTCSSPILQHLVPLSRVFKFLAIDRPNAVPMASRSTGHSACAASRPSP